MSTVKANYICPKCSSKLEATRPKCNENKPVVCFHCGSKMTKEK